MKRSIEVVTLGVFVLLFACAISGLAQQTAPGSPRPVSGTALPGGVAHVPSTAGTLFIPKTSQSQPTPPGHNFAAHTNVELFIPSGFTPEEGPPFSGYAYETPASLACHYGLVSTAQSPNCNPNSTTVVPTGGSQSIAIVDAFDDPSAASDLAWFSLQFGAPLSSASQFQVVWANTGNSSCPVNYGYGVPIEPSGGWELEESLDIEYAHAMAPNAKIYLVEACSNYDYDLEQAILVANNLVQCGQSMLNQSTGVLGTCSSVTGSGEVSMSWGEGEYPTETSDDSYFTGTNVVYLAAAGDGPGTIYPCTSPNVVCVGGTTNRRNNSTGNWLQETAWVFTGGGLSFYEAKPAYQASVGNNPSAYRGVPDISADADPYTGLWIYDTFPIDGYEYLEWYIVGGTSGSTPMVAGIVNNAGSRTGFATSSTAELNTIYNNRRSTADFTDIIVGYCGDYMGLSTLGAWDMCTGVGVPYSYAGK